MKRANPKTLRILATSMLLLAPGAVLAHAGGPHAAGPPIVLAHLLTSWHHLSGALVVLAALLVLARTIRGGGHGPRLRRRLDR